MRRGAAGLVVLALLGACSADPATRPPTSPAGSAAVPTAAVNDAPSRSPTAAPAPPDVGPPTPVHAGHLFAIAAGPGPQVPVGVVRSGGGQPVATSPALRKLSAIRAFSGVTGLVYGRRRHAPPSERSVAVDLGSGAVEWTSERWVVMTVSGDGRYVAAISSATGGDPDAAGILDAATGADVAELSLLGDGIGEAGMAFEPDGSLLVQVYRPTRRGLTWTVLRLRSDQVVERVTRVFATGDYAPPFAFLP